MTNSLQSDLLNARVLDTSCLMAIALRESDYQMYLDAMPQSAVSHLSAVSRVELGIVAKNKGITDEVNELLATLELNIVAFDDEQAELAITAFAQYGKGRHPAALNFGDCCAYALAKSLNLPLLYKGNDFAQTDIRSALAAYKPT